MLLKRNDEVAIGEVHHRQDRGLREDVLADFEGKGGHRSVKWGVERNLIHARQALASTLAPDAAEPELIAEELRRAALAMDRVVGRIGVEDVLGEIFARLCVGK